jgi:hypothetical protein
MLFAEYPLGIVNCEAAGSNGALRVEKSDRVQKKAEDEKCKVERELDRQLEDTFPANNRAQNYPRPAKFKGRQQQAGAR